MDYLDLKSNNERIIIDLSQLGFKYMAVLGHYSYNEAKQKLSMHEHTDMIEICYLDTGNQHYQVGEENFLLKGGDILITPPNVIHGTSGFPEEKGSLFWMILKVPSNPFNLLNLTKKETKLLVDNLLSFPSLHFKGSIKLKKSLMQIFSIYNGKSNRYRKIEIKNQVLNFLLEVIKCGDKLTGKQLAPDIDFICNHIKENVYQKLYIHELASKINLSESRFKHKFKLEVGVPPNEFILKEKLRTAKECMRNKDLSLTDLAYDLGFSSSSYFSTVFKKYEGVSPTEYNRFS